MVDECSGVHDSICIGMSSPSLHSNYFKLFLKTLIITDRQQINLRPDSYLK